jgi:hypothetical protein
MNPIIQGVFDNKHNHYYLERGFTYSRNDKKFSIQRKKKKSLLKGNENLLNKNILFIVII